MEEHHLMKFYLRYCCAMCFALISFLLAPPLSVQAQTREAYVAQGAYQTTLIFYYDDQRATRTGTTWGIEEKKKKGNDTYPAWAGTWNIAAKLTGRVVFDASFRDFRPTTTARWFCDYDELKQIEGVEYLNTSEVKDMRGMFSGCSRLTSLDLSHFNTQNVTGMGGMFSGCSGLTSLDVSHFNTQNVTDMRRMFSDCKALTSLDVSHFNTQNVTDMGSMFDGCSALATISSYTAWQCRESRYMFDGCTKLKGAVAYDKYKTDVTMANPKTGYFTRSNEAYVAQSADKKTLTFYYDRQRATRTGKSWGIEETKKEGGTTFPAWAGTWEVADSTTTRVVFDASFRNFRPTTTARWFNKYRALKQIEGLEYLNTSEVNNMSMMFSGCSGLTSLDLSHFNTQKVTDMGAMFSGCSGLTSLDLSHFNTQNVENMIRMFSGCSALNTIKCQEAWECSRSEGMFVGCTKLKGAVAYDKYKTDAKMANPETGYFTRSNDGGVEAYVAQSADKTTLTFYYDALRAIRAGKSWGIEETKKERDDTFPAWAGTWDVADRLTIRVVFDASFRDFRPTTTARWFSYYRALKQIKGLEYLNTAEVKDMSRMFYGCSGLTSLDLSRFNTQNVTNMGSMFAYCKSLTSLDLSDFNTQSVTNMSGMFWGCSVLPSLDVSHFNTQNVTSMGGMFQGCSGLTSLDVKNFNTQNVTDMSGMFAGCSGLTSLDVSHLNTQNVTDMGAMFSKCSGLTSLDLSHFNTQNVTDMVRMFYGCSALTTIWCNTDWRGRKSRDMFYGCTKLKGAVAYDENKTDVTMANPETGYFTRSNEAYVVQSADKTTLTFYYDDQRATRTVKSWGIEETKEEEIPAWAGTWSVADSTTTRVVFDASFRDFRPFTTRWWFENYRALKQIEGLEYLNTQNVTNMNGMFQGCSGLPSLDVSHFNTQNVTSMGGMFYRCSGLTSLDLSHFNTQNVTDMSWMFKGCSALTTIKCHEAWQCSRSEEMFAGCTKLKGTVAYDENDTDATMANPETGYFTAKPTRVESVRFGADSVQHIYTLQGKRVREAWKHLPAGVYVVNGKKTVKP